MGIAAFSSAKRANLPKVKKIESRQGGVGLCAARTRRETVERAVSAGEIKIHGLKEEHSIEVCSNLLN
jgi:hypothetical protein